MRNFVRKFTICHITGSQVNSNGSDLSNFIVYMTASMLLVDEIQGERPDLDTPP